MTERTTFPIMRDPEIKSVPWALMAPHGAAALVNHSQTLARLADRGGLTPAEAVAIIEDRRYMVMPIHEARDRLREYARGFESPLVTADFAEIEKRALANMAATGIAEALELAKAVRDNPGAPARYRLNKLITILERL